MAVIVKMFLRSFFIAIHNPIRKKRLINFVGFICPSLSVFSKPRRVLSALLFLPWLSVSLKAASASKFFFQEPSSSAFVGILKNMGDNEVALAWVFLRISFCARAFAIYRGKLFPKQRELLKPIKPIPTSNSFLLFPEHSIHLSWIHRKKRLVLHWCRSQNFCRFQDLTGTLLPAGLAHRILLHSRVLLFLGQMHRRLFLHCIFHYWSRYLLLIQSRFQSLRELYSIFEDFRHNQIRSKYLHRMPLL